MKSSRLLLIQGSLAFFADGYDKHNADLAAAGVTKEMYNLTRGTRVWRGLDLDKAKRTLEGFLTAAFKVSGMNPFAVTAEFQAAMIASLVNEANWQLAAGLCAPGLDGTKLIEVGGDEIESRELISPERQFNMVLLAYEQRAITLVPAEAAESTHPEKEGTKK